MKITEVTEGSVQLVLDGRERGWDYSIATVAAAYLINLGAKAQREGTRIDYGSGYATESIEFDDIDPLQVLRDASKENE